MANKLVFNPLTGNFDYVSDLSSTQSLVPSAVSGDIATLNSAGQVVDSGLRLNNSGTTANDLFSASEIISRIADLPVGVGSGIHYYLSATASDVSPYDAMSKTPDNSSEVVESVICVGGGPGVYGTPVLIGGYLATQSIGDVLLNAGGWTFNLYGSVNSNNAESVFQIDVYTRTASSVETLLFSATSSAIGLDIAALTTSETVQQAFSVNATDRLLFKIYAKVTGNNPKTVSLYHSGSTHYSNIATPIVENHNNLLGLQGGSSTERYHLTSTEHTKATQNATTTLTGLLSSTDWNKFNSKLDLVTVDNAISAYEALYVDPYHGLDTNNGGALTPFQTVQAAINSFIAATPKVIYVLGSTTAPITLRAGDQSMRIVFDPNTSHTGTITLVQSNTSIYFDSLDGSATIVGTINDGSSGAIYWSASMVNAVYNKTGGSSSVSPTGYTEFSVSSNIDGLALTLSGNTTVRTLGTGTMAAPTLTNGILALQHKGSVIKPSISGGANPLLGIPVLLVQSPALQLLSYSGVSLTCSATYGAVYLYAGSVLQADGSTLSPIDFTGSGASLTLVIGAGMQLAPTGNTLPSLVSYSTSALYLKSDYSPVNYSANNAQSIAAHLSAIDTALATYTKNLSLSVVTADFTAAKNNYYSINTTSSVITATLPATASSGDQLQFTDYAGTFSTNNFTINPNGLKINGNTSNIVLTTSRVSVLLKYIDVTQGWVIASAVNETSGSGSVSIDNISIITNSSSQIAVSDTYVNNIAFINSLIFG